MILVLNMFRLHVPYGSSELSRRVCKIVRQMVRCCMEVAQSSGADRPPWPESCVSCLIPVVLAQRFVVFLPIDAWRQATPFGAETTVL